jgi:glucosylceramidase
LDHSLTHAEIAFMKRFSLVAGVLFAVLACASRAQAAQVVGTASGECLDISHGIVADGTPMHQFHCHGSPNQQWTISNGHITGLGGSCLDVMGSAPTEGAQIIIVTCNGRPSQNWNISQGQIIGLGGKCLDVSGGSTLDGAPLILAACTSSPSQQWSVQ